MPRKTFKTAATALLAIPSTSSHSSAGGARTPRSLSPFPTSVSMTLPQSPHMIPRTGTTWSCRSSPGNASFDADRSIADDLQRIQIAEAAAGAPDIRPADPLPAGAVAAGLEREDWRQLLRSEHHYMLLRKVVGFLHDNRAQSSKHPNTARRLRQLNAELRADTSHRVLKFILNALFIAIGLLLLLSVLAAIGYTSTGQYCHQCILLASLLSQFIHSVQIIVSVKHDSRSKLYG